MKAKVASIFVLIVLSLAVPLWAAEPDRKIYYEKQTALPFPQEYILRFSLWNAVTHGDRVWFETQAVDLTSSTLSTYLGKKVPLDPAKFTEQLWVQVQKRNHDMTWSFVGAREKLPMVPYALWSSEGNTILNGTGMPGAAGVDGDFYIDTEANVIYGPRLGESWGEGTSLIGPKGPAGETGATGPIGPQGEPGPPVHTSAVCIGYVSNGDTDCSCTYRTITKVSGPQCSVTSDTGSCIATIANDYQHASCCVCAPY